MASTITSSFITEQPTEFYAQAFLESATLSTAGITIQNDVQYKYVPRSISMSGIINTGQTSIWNDGGTTTISEAPIEVKPFYVNKQENYKDYRTSWNGVVAGDALPADVENKLLEVTADQIKSDVESLLWKSSIVTGSTTGGTYTKGQFDGFVKLLNGNCVEIASNTMTVSNITAQLGKVYDAIPDAVKSIINQDPKKGIIFVSFKALGLYKQALAAQGINTTQNDYVATYLGIEVRGVDIFTNVQAAGLRKDFHCASNIALPDATINYKDMYPVTLERHARIEAEWKYAPAVTNVAQIVLAGY
jgi:hypothetical protein